MRTASGPPSYIISSLTREVSQKREKEETGAMSSEETNSKMSPLTLLSRQSSAPTRPELSPIKDILEFVHDSSSRSREADSDSSRGKLMSIFLLSEFLCNRFHSVSLKL